MESTEERYTATKKAAILSVLVHSKANFPSGDPLAPHLLVAAELERVEQRLTGRLQSREPLLNEIGRYLIGAGGKRVRPAVVLMMFRACGGEDPTDIITLPLPSSSFIPLPSCMTTLLMGEQNAGERILHITAL